MSSILQDMYFLFISELKCMLATTPNTCAVANENSRASITSLPDIKKVIYMVRHFSHRRK